MQTFRKLINFSRNGLFQLNKNCLNKRNFTQASLVFIGLSFQNFYVNNKSVNSDENKPLLQQQQNQEKIKALKNLNPVDAGNSSSLQEGQMKEIMVQDGDNEYPIVLIRWNGKVYAVGGIDTYDGKTRLVDGICFENKLYSPLYGSAFNISSGEVELGPASDDLPRFFVEEKNGKIIVYTPQFIPKRIVPQTYPRDYNDLRKVVIIGSGAAAMGCIETLKKFGYSGEITVVTRELTYPYDKTKLSKEIKNIDYDKILLRDQDWYKSNGIQIMFGKECAFVDKTHGKQHILLEDGTKIEYDVLLLAIGSIPENRKIKGIQQQQNIQYLRDIQDHKQLKKNLDNVKTVTIMGSNLWALETAATIRKQYKNVKEIYVIDENDKMWIEDKFGDKIANQIVEEHLNNDIYFVRKNELVEVIGDEQKINKIKFKNGLQLDTDLLLLFPTNEICENEFVLESEMDQFEFDETGRFITDFYLRSDYKRIFCAGNCANTVYFATNEKIPGENWNQAYHQGETAAYNMLALRIPFHQIPFFQTEQFDKKLQYIGYATNYNDIYIDGSVEKWDFIAYYGFYDEIVAVAGTPSKRKAVQIMNEAIRLELIPLLQDFKKKRETVESIEQLIRKSKRSGCFRERIHLIQDDPYQRDVMWMHRDRSSEFYSFWDQGLNPTENNITRED